MTDLLFSYAYINIPAWLLPFITPFLHSLTAHLTTFGLYLLNHIFCNHLIAQEIIPFFLISPLPLELPPRSSFPTPNFCASQITHTYGVRHN